MIHPIAAAIDISPVVTPHSSLPGGDEHAEALASAEDEEHPKEHRSDHIPPVETSATANRKPSAANKTIRVKNGH